MQRENRNTISQEYNEKGRFVRVNVHHKKERTSEPVLLALLVAFYAAADHQDPGSFSWYLFTIMGVFYAVCFFVRFAEHIWKAIKNRS